jgi:tRNA (adenine37-N6)-methyltransferase
MRSDPNANSKEAAISEVLTMQPIGYVRSPYKETQDIPKGLGAKHEAEGVLEIRPEFDLGLTDIEGFSHLFVIWVFDRSGGFELLGTPPSDTRTHGVFATRSPKRPNPIGLTVVELQRREARSFTSMDSTCLMELRSSTSNLIFRTFRRTGYGVAGWQKPKRDHDFNLRQCTV